MPSAPRSGARPQLVVLAGSLLALGIPGGALAGGGGIDAPEPPDVNDVYCVERCADVRVAAAGSRIELSGRHLDAVQTVSFNADGGERIKVEARRATERTVSARVPADAVTGRPRVKDDFGNGSTAPERLRIVAAEEIPEGGTFRLASAEATPHKVYFYGRRDPAVDSTFKGDGPTDVRIDVIDRSSGSIVSTFRQSEREPFAPNTARWDGRTESGRAAPDGASRSRIGPVSGGAAETTSGARFSLYGHKFPIRGRHNYGDGFGAGRGHMGQDVFAKCGTKLVAARGGRVTFKDSHPAAGNYVVISGKRSRFDYMYAHLLRPAGVREGQRVRTGEVIGKVGQTGNASGCHLHFELWKGDWQQGGDALASVTRKLKLWDSWS